ncbi:hypothetical protein jhhlp_002552 [Lomentospora prolificans]|uniref:DNA (cytosine-5)-methyltransferase 1 replication foci domain-containing protein n=1 Tax=Lomentospora prolificans TaxID=41688 RepID=A0A2N3NED6_9PEZI|nr:hypothetical protein jhhlp_002552 [Lomentospora prolificans]
MARRSRLQAEASPAPATSDNDLKSRAKESEVLFPVDKSLPDDDWPTFLLKDAVVSSLREEETLENLLLVEARGPFKVQGRILVDIGDRLHMAATRARRPPRTIELEITGVRMSIGWGDGPRIWVASDYGFFEIIHASPEYAPLYRTMMEAITLYYTVQQIYDSAEKAGEKDLDVDEVLFRYVLDTGEVLVKEEVEDLCHRHAQFLASHFEKESDFDWAGKQFTKYIKGLAKNNKKRRGSSLPHRPLPTPTPATEEPRASRTRSVRQASTASAKSQSAAVILAAQADQPEPTTVPSIAPAASIIGGRSQATASKLYEAILDTCDLNDLGRATVKSLTGKLYFGYKFRAYKSAADAMMYYSHDLVRLMNSDKTVGPKWPTSPLYTTLAAIKAPLQPDELEHITPDQIESSLIKRKQTQPSRSSGGDAPAVPIGGKGPSAPKPSGKAPHLAGYNSASDASSGIVRRRRGRPSGLRLSNPRKRPLSDPESAALGGRASTSSKRSRTYHEGYGDDMDDAGDDGTNAESSSSESSEDITLSDGESDQVPARIVLDVEDLPSTSPLGPNGTWVCEHGSCGHIVRAADEPAGQQAVREHLHVHEEDRSSKVQLAMAEGRATGHRSIEHLLDKLKQIGRQELETSDLNKPQPIQKRHGLLF